MIKLELDEAFCFDLLSIKKVKFDKNPSAFSKQEYELVFSQINNQIENKKFYDILNSEEYKNLYLINSEVYESVDLAKNNRITAQKVDYLNWVRFIRKKTIQEKFFNTIQNEQKFGYDKWFYLFVGDSHKIVILDEEDFLYFKDFTVNTYGKQYPCSKGNFIHRIIAERIFGEIPKNLVVDHINNNTFDARRKNLRICSSRENIVNTFKTKRNTSGFKGVTKFSDKWVAQIRYNNKVKRIGYFDTKEEAAVAYFIYDKKLNGVFSKTVCPEVSKEVFDSVYKFIHSYKKKRSSSKYYGVSFYKKTSKWKAEININKKRYFIGYFDNEDLAALEVDKKLIEYNQIERLNFNKKDINVYEYFNKLINE